MWRHDYQVRSIFPKVMDWWVWLFFWHLLLVRLWWSTVATPSLHIYKYCFQHISSQSYEDFICCNFFPCCDVIRFSLALLQKLCIQCLEVSITFEFYVVPMTNQILKRLNLFSYAVPLSMYLLSMPLPYLPQGSSLSPFFLLGSAVLLIGLILYNIPRTQKQDTEL